MAVPIFDGEFTTTAVEPPPDFQKPAAPRMQGNRLLNTAEGWRLEIVWVYPSGRKRFSSSKVAGNEGDVRLVLSGAYYWKHLYETLIIDMQGKGEGLDVSLPGTRH